MVHLALCQGAAAQPQVLKWNLEATVYSIDDPHHVFPDLRLGDHVRGTMAYNVNANRTWDDFFFGTAYYFLGPTFPVTEMVIENPRTGVDLEFKLDEHGDDSAVYLEKYEGPPGDDRDLFYTNQQVLMPVPLPNGLEEGEFNQPSLEVFFAGPPGRLSSPELPVELNLADWTRAADISFYDRWVYDISNTRIEATIYSLTPVPFETIPGDFNADGLVNDYDNTIWRRMFGQTEANEDAIDADADGSGEIDAADYVVWRHALSAADALPGSTDHSTTGVPEPPAVALAALSLVLFVAQHRHKTPTPVCVNTRNPSCLVRANRR